jgi:hypothetical protein
VASNKRACTRLSREAWENKERKRLGFAGVFV